MRFSTSLIAVSLLAALVACSRETPDAPRLSADLEKDLASASAASLELATGARGYQQMRFVSDIEQVAVAQPAPQRPKRQPSPAERTDDEARDEVAPVQEVAEEVSEPIAQPAEPSEELASAPRVPSVSPRPAPVPVDMSVGSGGGAISGPGSREGPDWGTVIGVILRGGTVGPGHCPPARRPRGPGGTGRPPR